MEGDFVSCTECKDGYFLLEDVTTKNKVCKPCKSKINNCQKCQTGEPVLCLTCENGFRLLKTSKDSSSQQQCVTSCSSGYGVSDGEIEF